MEPKAFQSDIIDTMTPSIAHGWDEETPEAKARWFQSLTIQERLRIFTEWSRFVLAINPRIVDIKHARSPRPGIQILSKV
jgi:hypothetical protein